MKPRQPGRYPCLFSGRTVQNVTMGRRQR